MALSYTLDKLGPLARSADDCGLVLAAIAGPDDGDDTTIPTPYRYTPEVARTSGFRLGVLAGAAEGAQPEVAANFAATLDALREIASIEEVTLPDYPYGPVTSMILAAEAASAFEAFVRSGKVAELTAPEDCTGGYAGRMVSGADYVTAIRLRRRIVRDLAPIFARYDAILAPTTNAVASPLTTRFSQYYRAPGMRRPVIGAAGNVAGLPAIGVPNGFGERGLPTSVQFVGGAGAENAILAVARAYQERTDWHTKTPPV